MAGYAVQLLGDFRVLVDGRSVDTWRHRRAADLVKVLSLAPSRSLHRGQVMDLLWPDLLAGPAGANLRKALHYARRALGANGAIGSTAGILTLAEAEIDIDRFAAAAADAIAAGDPDKCGEVAQLYTGDLLPADRYQPWAEAPRERLRKRYLDVLKGARQWDRVLAVDATDEQSHRELMREHLQAGQRREAIRQFHQLRDALREYLGVSPDADTVALYEQVLALDGPEPVSPVQRATAAVATGFVHLNRHEYAEAERLARYARELAIHAGNIDEITDATTLLALVSFRTGRWQEVSHREFTTALTMTDELARITYEANLCFAEYYLAGAESTLPARRYAEDLYRQSLTAPSELGRGLAQLILGEALLMSGELQQARDHLRSAHALAVRTQAECAQGVALERLAQAELALGQRARASTLIADAQIPAATSRSRVHLLVRILGVGIQSSAHTATAIKAVIAAERSLAQLPRVCEPCSMNYHVQAAIACARADDLPRARSHIADAERIAGVWQAGPASAAVWEARAALRQAEGNSTQAAALLREAALEYARAHRPIDQQRCQQAARTAA